MQDEIFVQPDGVLARSDLFLVPPLLKNAVLAELHKGHMGMEKVLMAGTGL